MRSTIRMVDQLLEKAKQYALANGSTFTAIVEEAFREKLMGRPAVKKQSRDNLKIVTGQGVNSGIDLDDTASLLYVMDSNQK